IYFHLCLQYLWEELANLPAIFPNGRPLDRSAYPWLLNSLVCAYFVQLEHHRPTLFRLQAWISILFAWWIVPATMVLFWVRYLCRHDWLGTGLHIIMLTAATGIAILFHKLAKRTLEGKDKRDYSLGWRHILLRLYRQILTVLVLALVFYLC